VVRREIARRQRGVGVEPGATHLEGLFLRFEGAWVLGARLWGPESGAWLLLVVRRPESWRSVEPWLDLRALNLAAPRTAARVSQRPFRQLRLAFPGDDLARAWNERAKALPAALLSVPDWAIHQAARMSPHDQWRILQFLNATRERGRDLCQSNLPLAFLLASRGEAVGIRAAEAVSSKQRRILGAFGFPEQEAAVRVLRRVDERVLDCQLLDHLRVWTRDQACLRRLAHVPRLGAAGLAFRNPSDLAWFDDRALAEVLGTDDPRTLRYLHEFARLMREVQRLGYDPPGRLSSVRQVRQRCEELRRHLKELANLPANHSLPDPPIPGIPGVIEPLRTVHDIHLEGKRMRHCVRVYVRDALEQRVALYRVLKPQRATLSLVRGRSRWRIGQLKLCANRKPSADCFATVHWWLRKSTTPAPRPPSAQGMLLPE
jgi:hypothetical protein